MTSPADILRFILGGKAVFTVLSPSGCRFTYRVTRDGKGGDRFFVGVLSGPDNVLGYSYLGTIFEGRRFRVTRGSKITADAKSARAFTWLWERVFSGQGLGPVLFYHSGKCPRCNLPLTTPESLERGFGPTCIEKVAHQ